MQGAEALGRISYNTRGARETTVVIFIGYDQPLNFPLALSPPLDFASTLIDSTLRAFLGMLYIPFVMYIV